MKSIVFLGVGPLPYQTDKTIFGPGVRTNQFVQAIISAGFKIDLFTIPFGKGKQERKVEKVYEDSNLSHHSVYSSKYEIVNNITDFCIQYKPICIVTTTDVMANISSQIKLELPIWNDFYGLPMAEAQMLAFRYDSDDGLLSAWQRLLSVWRRGDKFSGASMAQENAMVGILSTIGRLNKYTTGYQFTYTIPPYMPEKRLQHTENVLRGKGGVSPLISQGRRDVAPTISEDDFLVLWQGGYNTWTDIETLFKGLELAMEKDERIKYVSVGGKIDGHDEVTYPRFEQLVERSKFKDRFILLGWLPTGEVANYCLECDAGINIDAYSYEGIFGTRTRIMDWINAKLPVITTTLCELAFDLGDKGLVETFPIGDYKVLAEKILKLAGNKSEAKAMADKAYKYTKNAYNVKTTAEPLIEWLQEPSLAPDNSQKLKNKILFDDSKFFNSLEELHKNQSQYVAIINDLKKKLEETEKELNTIKGKRSYKLYSNTMKLLKRRK